MRSSKVHVAILACFVAAACSLEHLEDHDSLEVVEVKQGTFTGGDYPLQVERVDEPRVLELRLRERLDDVAAGSKKDIDRFKKLTAWARSQFEPGVPDPYPLCNGLSILRDIRSGRTGGFCGQYSYLLADALKSFGHFGVRHVELESQSGIGHFAVEAWSNDLGRWVLLDPLNAALYYEGETPLAAIEIHDALIAGRAGAIRVSRLPLLDREKPPARVGEPRGTASQTNDESDGELLSRFYNIAVALRNDFAGLDSPLSQRDRERLFVRFLDPRIEGFKNMNFMFVTPRREDILRPLNQIAIEIKPDPESEQFHLFFSTRGTSPHFMRYRVRLGNGSWRDSGPQMTWSPTAGDSTLEVRTVNAYEILGPIFTVKVRV